MGKQALALWVALSSFVSMYMAALHGISILADEWCPIVKSHENNDLQYGYSRKEQAGRTTWHIYPR